MISSWNPITYGTTYTLYTVQISSKSFSTAFSLENQILWHDPFHKVLFYVKHSLLYGTVINFLNIIYSMSNTLLVLYQGNHLRVASSRRYCRYLVPILLAHWPSWRLDCSRVGNSIIGFSIK